jgi:hypothetical protein
MPKRGPIVRMGIVEFAMRVVETTAIRRERKPRAVLRLWVQSESAEVNLLREPYADAPEHSGLRR